MHDLEIQSQVTGIGLPSVHILMQSKQTAKVPNNSIKKEKAVLPTRVVGVYIYFRSPPNYIWSGFPISSNLNVRCT